MFGSDSNITVNARKKQRTPNSEVQRLAEGKRTEEKCTDNDPNSTMQNKYDDLPKLF